MSNFIWSLKELHRFRRSYIPVMIIDAAVKGILPVVSLVVIQRMIDLVQYRSGSLRDVITLLVFLMLFQLACVICTNVSRLKLDNYGLEFDAHFQAKILKKVAVLDSKDIENSRTYDLINRTQYDANAGIMGSLKTLFSMISLLISTVSYMVIIIRFSLLLFAVVLVPPVVRYFFEKKYNLLEYETEKENTEPNRRAAYISYLLTEAGNFKEIKMFSLFDYFIHRFESIRACCNLKQIRLHGRRAVVYSIVSVFETVVDCLVTLVILIRAFEGVVSIGSFVLYSNSIDSIKENLVSIFSQLSVLYKNSAMIEQVRAFFEIPTEEIREDGVEIGRIRSIRLDRVSYKYRGSGTYSVKDVSFELKNGEFAVFMGRNGSGKSTLMKIIMGIYHDYEGDIYINGIDLRFLNIEQYRKKIGVLFQDYIKYESSISENICCGDPELREKEAEIGEILESVCLSEMRDKKDQALGYQFNDGIQMSVGQWQKLALGRALAREADVYIFDEPNASMDLVSENAVLDTIRRETEGRIALLIMHRFNRMVEQADVIFVLDKGRIAERGPHRKLLKEKGIYHELYSIHKEIGLTPENGDL